MTYRIAFGLLALAGLIYLLYELAKWIITVAVNHEAKVREQERIDAEEITRDMQHRARQILKDRPKRFPAMVSGTVHTFPRDQRPPIGRVLPQDKYLDHPHIKPAPVTKPDLVESPQPIGIAEDIAIVIGLQDFGSPVATVPEPIPAPDFNAGGGDAGGAGSSMSWEPESAAAPDTSNDVCQMPDNYNSGDQS